MIAALLAAVLTLLQSVIIPPPQPPRIEVRVASLMDILRGAGFTGEGLRIAYAVVRAESAGNARAHNPDASTGDNSYGLFQINMLGSMGPERRRQYGLSSNEDLYDPVVNARVAYKMSNGGRNWQPWSTYNRGDYRQFLGGSDITIKNYSGSGGGGGGSEIGEAASGSRPNLSRNEAAESYGFVEQLFAGVPELKKLFDKAVKETWTPAKFQSEIRNTTWWKSTTETERQYLTKLYGDPATARTLLSNNRVKVWTLAAQVGATPSNALAEKLVYGMSAYGWTDARLRQELVKSIELGDTPAGEAGEVVAQLKEYGWQMGVSVVADWAMEEAKNIVGAGHKLEESKAYIRKLAKGQFGNWAKQIDAGQTIQDLASPFVQSMSQILELPPGSVTIWDPTIRGAMQHKDPSTGEREVQQIWEFENQLRDDPRWKKTKNAQDSIMQVAHQVLSDFGFKT